MVRYKNFQSGRNFWGFEGDSLIIGSFLCGCFFCLSSFCPIERLLFVSINTIRLSSFWRNCPLFFVWTQWNRFHLPRSPRNVKLPFPDSSNPEEWKSPGNCHPYIGYNFNPLWQNWPQKSPILLLVFMTHSSYIVRQAAWKYELCKLLIS